MAKKKKTQEKHKKIKPEKDVFGDKVYPIHDKDIAPYIMQIEEDWRNEWIENGSLENAHKS